MSEAAADGVDQLVGAWVAWWQDVIDASHDSVSTSVRWEWMLQPPLRWSEPATTQATSAYGALGGALPPQDVEVPDE